MTSSALIVNDNGDHVTVHIAGFDGAMFTIDSDIKTWQDTCEGNRQTWDLLAAKMGMPEAEIIDALIDAVFCS